MLVVFEGEVDFVSMWVLLVPSGASFEERVNEEPVQIFPNYTDDDHGLVLRVTLYNRSRWKASTDDLGVNVALCKFVEVIF